MSFTASGSSNLFGTSTFSEAMKPTVSGTDENISSQDSRTILAEGENTSLDISNSSFPEDSYLVDPDPAEYPFSRTPSPYPDAMQAAYMQHKILAATLPSKPKAPLNNQLV